MVPSTENERSRWSAKEEKCNLHICKKETPEKEDMRKHYEDDHSTEYLIQRC